MFKNITLLGALLLATAYAQTDAEKRVDACIKICDNAANFPCIGQCMVIYAQEVPRSPIGSAVNDIMVHCSSVPAQQSPPSSQISPAAANPNPEIVSTSIVIIKPTSEQSTTQTYESQPENNTPGSLEHSSESHTSTDIVSMSELGSSIDTLISSTYSRTDTQDTEIPAATGIPNFDSIISSITSGAVYNVTETSGTSATTTATNTASDGNDGDGYVVIPSSGIGIPVSVGNPVLVSIPLFTLTILSLYL